jgi:hypothetical protein
VKVGDLVKFKNPDFHESYGVGVIAGEPQPGFALGDLRGKYFDIPVYFKDEIIYAREDELESISESR